MYALFPVIMLWRFGMFRLAGRFDFGLPRLGLYILMSQKDWKQTDDGTYSMVDHECHGCTGVS